MHKISIEPLSQETFQPFGQVIEMRGDFDFTFNEGRADRWADLANLDIDRDGKLGISMCVSRPITLPYTLEMMERHPLASQAFIPMNSRPFIVFTAEDIEGTPFKPRAFLTNGKQGINYNRDTWHGVLSPIDQDQEFLIIDRICGSGNNLKTFQFDTPYLIG